MFEARIDPVGPKGDDRSVGRSELLETESNWRPSVAIRNTQFWALGQRFLDKISGILGQAVSKKFQMCIVITDSAVATISTMATV